MLYDFQGREKCRFLSDSQRCRVEQERKQLGQGGKKRRIKIIQAIHA
jgi:hypothetical protein